MILFAVGIAIAVLGVLALIGMSGGFATKPCARCHVEGGQRWVKERKVGNRLVREQVCGECRREIFFGAYGVDWKTLPEPEVTDG